MKTYHLNRNQFPFHVYLPSCCPKLIVFRYLWGRGEAPLVKHFPLLLLLPGSRALPRRFPLRQRGCCVRREERLQLPPPCSSCRAIISRFSMGNSLTGARINSGAAARGPQAVPDLHLKPERQLLSQGERGGDQGTVPAEPGQRRPPPALPSAGTSRAPGTLSGLGPHLGSAPVPLGLQPGDKSQEKPPETKAPLCSGQL